ncbi:MAG: hypothetical protein AAFR34_10240 [Pseudomonadota bacterium]
MLRHFTGVALAGLIATAGAAKADGPINFVLWNNGPGQSFDGALWMRLIAARYHDGITVVASPETGPDRIKAAVQSAAGAEPETVVVMTTVELDLAEDAFAQAFANFDAARGQDATFKDAMILVDAPLCRAMQTPMAANDYTPYTFVYTAPAGREACYTAVLDTLYERDGSGTAVDETALVAQAAMPAMYSMGWKFIDLDDPEQRKIRESRTFAPGEQILFQTTFDYVRKAGAGAPGATFKVRLDLEVTDKATGEVMRIDDLRTYEGTVSHRVPVDATYFRNWFRGGIDLKDPGEYTLSYIFTDLNAEGEAQVPVPISVDVTIAE